MWIVIKSDASKGSEETLSHRKADVEEKKNEPGMTVGTARRKRIA